MPQLTHVASCDWWKGDGGSMWGHSSTNHNSPHGRVVTFIVPLYVALDLFFLNFWVSSELWHLLCHFMWH